MPKRVRGFIIRAANSRWFLEKKLYWYKHDKPTEAYVHPASTVEHIRSVFADLRSRAIPGDALGLPKTMTPATWSKADGVVLTEEPEKQFPSLD